MDFGITKSLVVKYLLRFISLLFFQLSMISGISFSFHSVSGVAKATLLSGMSSALIFGI